MTLKRIADRGSRIADSEERASAPEASKRYLRLSTVSPKRLALIAAAVAAVATSALIAATLAGLAPPTSLRPTATRQPRILARDGADLSVSYLEPWNVNDTVSYHEVPELLREAFRLAEDRRFYEHRGVDWLARAHAVVQAVRAGRVVRGASTITEQVVRILNPRPRTPWSRWLEGIEARIVEQRFSKTEIFECYLNQVPYAANRRGVVQAARSYFDRDLDTLGAHEMLALAVVVRSPSRLDLERGTADIRAPLERLARRMHSGDLLEDGELDAVLDSRLEVVRPRLEVEAAHFVRFVRAHAEASGPGNAAHDRRPSVVTTLDPSLQARVQRILDRQVADLGGRGVTDGAALVVDHVADEVLAWVDAYGFSDRPGGQIDKVLAPRQPGSTLKPFVYALALEKGWTGATIIDDSPLVDSVGHGLHRYRNYSRQFYGPLRLREALGNSLNVPAVRTAQFVGRDLLLQRLRDLGFSSLDDHADHYGDGLALGNGEVTLFELVRAYAALARGGVFRELRVRDDRTIEDRLSRRVFDPEASSLIADILSDPDARSREFGRDSVLALPNQTAIKTGTSNDHRDAWTVGFCDRYTVGVWMGNVDGTPTEQVSGSQGPALVVRSIFAELNRHRDPGPLYLSRRLVPRTVCTVTGAPAGASCPSTTEWFREDSMPMGVCRLHDRAAPSPEAITARASGPPRLISPVAGLHIAKDPRIPDDLERFPLRLADGRGVRRARWLVDGELVGNADHDPLLDGVRLHLGDLVPVGGGLCDDAVDHVDARRRAAGRGGPPAC